MKLTTVSYILIFLLSMPIYGQQKRDINKEENSKLVTSSIAGGQCFLQHGKRRLPVRPGTPLSHKDIVVLNAGTTLIAVEPKAVLRYTFKGPYIGTIRNYIQQTNNTCIKSITLKYVDYLLAQAFKGRKHNSRNIEDDDATVFRKVGIENDSVIISLKTMDSLYNVIDSLSPQVK